MPLHISPVEKELERYKKFLAVDRPVGGSSCLFVL